MNTLTQTNPEFSVMTGGFVEKPAKIFCVASFNDWMPVEMKTIRSLTLEKTTFSEPAALGTFHLDNSIKLYANMVSPGPHYFFFVREQG